MQTAGIPIRNPVDAPAGAISTGCMLPWLKVFKTRNAGSGGGLFGSFDKQLTCFMLLGYCNVFCN
jgi:hypothetical protein